jgi:hypothetical protein
MRSSLWDIRLWIILFVALIYVNVAFAQSEHHNRGNVTQSNDMNNQTAGDLAVEGSVFNGGDAFAFAHALGDVDINDCLASVQWGTIIVSKQKVVLNAWCAAEVYDAKGMYEMAAMMRCNVPAIIAEFDNEDECERVNTFHPPPTKTVPHPSVTHEDLYRQEQLAVEQYDALAARLAEIENKPRPAPRPTTVIQQTEFINDEKRAQLRALRDEDEDQ